ncbi:MAG: hypothetical protein KTR31_30625 [Myxococcales bacterium]|nr:hypothetical protein [Myxococcales bacterium]
MSELQAHVDEAAALLSAHRGAMTAPPVRVVSTAEMMLSAKSWFDAYVTDDQRAATDCATVALGLGPRGVGMMDMIVASYSRAAGVFQPADGAILLHERVTPGQPGFEEVVLHELVHARQHQRFDLFDPSAAPLSSDAAHVRRLLAEGDASFTTLQLALGNEVDWVDLDAMGHRPPRRGEGNELTRFVHSLVTQPYLLGPPAVQTLRRDGGWDRVDALLAKPPATTEQLLDPSRPHDPAVSVSLDVSSALGPEWSAHPSRTLGAFELESLLWAWLPADDALSVALGWGGDRFQCLEHTDGRAGFVWRTAWDTPEDAGEFQRRVRLRRRKALLDEARRGDDVLVWAGLPDDRASQILEAAWSTP